MDASVGDAAVGATTQKADAASVVHADSCRKSNGICVASGTCTKSGGVVTKDANAGGCVLDTGAAECCVPPTPTADPTNCSGEGGACTSYAACDATGGYHSSDTSCGGGVVCCVPHASCGDATFSCCGETGTVFAPDCNAGALQCPARSNPCAGAADQ